MQSHSAISPLCQTSNFWMILISLENENTVEIFKKIGKSTKHKFANIFLKQVIF